MPSQTRRSRLQVRMSLRGRRPWQSSGGMLRLLRFVGQHSTLLPPSFTRGDVQAKRRTGGSMRYRVSTIATLRRIRTAAGLPPPFGHPPHKCGGQGYCACLWCFGHRMIVPGNCHVALLLAMTVVVGGWSFYDAWVVIGTCSGGSMPRPYFDPRNDEGPPQNGVVLKIMRYRAGRTGT